MTSSGTEVRAPAVAELFRDFESILNTRLKEERQRRHQVERLARMSVAVAIAALVVGAAIAFAVFTRRGPGIAASVVRTREIRLLDEHGQVRGRWSMLPQGGSRLSFVDDHGTERLRLTLLANGSQGITLADARGEGRVVLSLEGGEGSRLTFADAGGRPRTVLGLSSQQAATLIFADQEGAPRAALGLEPDGRATFALPEARSRDVANDAPADTTTEGRSF
jgi:hypothetical protein